MTPDAFTEILEKCTGYTEHIYLHVLGEPLLHPDIGLLLDFSEAYGFRVNLTTNGTLLAQNGQLLLSKAALRQVNVSLHSIEQTRSPEAFHLYLDGVLAFIRSAGSPPPMFINLRLWNLHKDTFDLNERILERLASFFKLPSPIIRNDARSLPLAPGVFLSWDRRFEWPHAPAPDFGSYGRCRGLHDHIAILVDGTVVPCCLDAEADIPLGNILQGSLTEILAGSRAVSMREGFTRQRIIEPLCRRCEYKKRFAAVRDRKEMKQSVI
jgi:radical SAM protein with 4Fe4S-binding SPASM domain